MAVGREIKVAVRPKRRKLFIARSIDRRAEIFRSAEPCCSQPDTPKIQSAESAGHIRREIQPLTVGRNSRMRIARKRIPTDNQLCCLAPNSISTGRLHDFCITRNRRARRTLCEIHRPLIDRKRASTLIRRCIHSPVNRPRLAPYTPIILFRNENIALLSTRNSAELRTQSLTTRRSEIQSVIAIAAKHG